MFTRSPVVTGRQSTQQTLKDKHLVKTQALSSESVQSRRKRSADRTQGALGLVFCFDNLLPLGCFAPWKEEGQL